MAFKLTKAEAKELEQLSMDYEAARCALADRLDEIASEWETEWSEKSERWQEGEAGQLAQEKCEMVRSWHDEMPEEGTPIIDVDSLA